MKNTILLFLYFCFVMLASCSKEKAGCFSSAGSNSTIIRTFPYEIDSIKAEGRLTINFIQDSLNFVEISGGANVIKGIYCNTNGQKLNIKDKNTCNWVRKLKNIPKVTIHYTTLHYFDAENFFDNVFITEHNGDNIYMEYWGGSGCTFFKGKVNSACFVVHAGAGNFKCEGSANYTYVYNAGTSKIDCSKFVSDDTYIHTLSNNYVYVNTKKSITALIKRTGNVYYKGNPEHILKMGSGAGKLEKNG